MSGKQNWRQRSVKRKAEENLLSHSERAAYPHPGYIAVRFLTLNGKAVEFKHALTRKPSLQLLASVTKMLKVLEKAAV